MQDIKILVSIKEASQRTGLTKLSLRTLCKENKINYVKSGKKFLVNYNSLIEKLDKGELKEV